MGEIRLGGRKAAELTAEQQVRSEGLARPTPAGRLEGEQGRAAFERHPPGPTDLAAVEQGDPCFLPVQVAAVRSLVAALKEERMRRGLSLTDVSERSRLTRPAISRLENGRRLNPTLDTLY